MRTLRDFLLAESVLREGQEYNNKTKNKSDDAPPVPNGYSRSAISGRISKTGLALLKNYTGDEAVKYSDVKLSDISVKNIKSKFGVSSGAINDLDDLCSTRGLFSSTEGAEIMKQLFTGFKAAGTIQRGIGGYSIQLRKDWQKLADTGPSSEKIIMFWINSLYNVYVNRSIDKTKLRFYFANDGSNFIVQEP